MLESTSDRIINASIDLFSISGYTETSIRDIAKKVGIKTSTIYYHFESKEAILSSILNEFMDMVRNSINRSKWYEEKQPFTSEEPKTLTKEVMNYMFFSFQPPNVGRYRKMVKIICGEAVRNNSVREYFCNQCDFSFNYIKAILDALIAAGKTQKCDTVKMSAVLYSITFAFMHLDSMEIQAISKSTDTGMFSLLEYLLKTVTEDSL